jgi:outer membrane protein OmpA-like peptidoglycan-associated protein
MGVVALGSAAPVADGSTPEGRARNRRVTVVVVRTPGSSAE